MKGFPDTLLHVGARGSGGKILEMLKTVVTRIVAIGALCELVEHRALVVLVAHVGMAFSFQEGCLNNYCPVRNRHWDQRTPPSAASVALPIRSPSGSKTIAVNSRPGNSLCAPSRR